MNMNTNYVKQEESASMAVAGLVTGIIAAGISGVMLML